jgi:hypothetical protein
MKTTGRPAYIFGADAAVEQGSRIAWDYYGGEVAEEQFEGPSDKLKSLYDSYLAVAGSNPTIESVSFDARQGIGLMVVRRAYDGAIKYELLSNRIMRPVHQHSYFASAQGEVAAMTAAEVRAVYLAFDEGSEPGGDWTAKQKSLMEHLTWGVLEATVKQHVLRETRIITKRSLVKAAHDTALTVESPPNTSAVNSLIGGATLAGLEWLRGLTDVVQIGGKKWAIVTEWESALQWSTQLYGGTWNLSGA